MPGSESTEVRERLVVGRDAETGEIARFLDGVAAGPAGLVLAGGAGIGKTTLLRWSLSKARSSGLRVLEARPSEGEAQVAFAGLADLFAELPAAVLDVLPPPQRRALAIALRQADGDPNVDPLAISQAVLGVVRRLTADGALVIAIDDAPWLDAPTARVLEHAVRRLVAEPVAVMATVRSGRGDAADAPVVRAVGHDRLRRVDLGGLGVEEVGRLIGDRLGRAPRRSVAVRIRELSGGNPFFALELALAFRQGDPEAGPEAIQVPESLGGLVRERLAGLSPEARVVVLLAATATQPTTALVMEAGASANPSSGLAEALASGVLEARPDGRLAFSHPLLAWSAYADAPLDRRLDAHRRLAVVAHDVDERIRHRAVVATEPDEAVAADLDAAADRAHDRGAPEIARDLELEALRLTPNGRTADGRRRTLAAAEFAIQAGDGPWARGLLERFIAATEPGPARARPISLLADIRSGDDWEAKLELLAMARAEAEPGGVDQAEAEVASGMAHWMLVRDIPAGIDHLRAGVETAGRCGDPAVTLRAIASLVFLETWAGELDGALERLAEAVAMEASAPGVRLIFLPSYVEALVLERSDRPVETERAWRLLLERADHAGDADSRPLILLNLAMSELRLGRSDLAARHLLEGEIASDLLGHDSARAFGASCRAQLEARLGDAGRTRAAAAAGMDLAARTKTWLIEDGCRTALAQLELSLGDHRAAAQAILPAARRMIAAGVPHVPGFSVVPLAAEATALAGHVDEAESLLARLWSVGSRLDHSSTLRDHHRGRAILEAARGDLDASLESSRLALVQADRAEFPFERARTLLVHGEVLRRLRQRAAAREALAAALATFETIGARIWAQRARSELARAGGPTDLAGIGALTPTQHEVAALVAAGRTNREVAETLFMSPHTVEAHLTAIYRTLGIRTRTDLAREIAASGARPGPLPGGGDGKHEAG